MFPHFVGKTITLPHEISSSAPSPPTSTLLFSSSLHTVTFALCQIPDKYARSFKLPLLKRLSFLEVDISDVSLQSIISHGCPALEWLLLVCNNLDHCIIINSGKVEVICILCENGELVVEDAPSLKWSIHDIQSRHLQITVFSAPKLECLGNFYEGFPESKIVLALQLSRYSTFALYCLVAFVPLPKFHAMQTFIHLVLWYVLGAGFVCSQPINGGSICEDPAYQHVIKSEQGCCLDAMLS